ncbi:MAG: amidohydrolase [Chloroflexi bacterium]|nr:amidohydrolase [Chloroflexota bacterium]
MTDLLIRRADIWTGDPARPRAKAALIRHGRFVTVGDEADVGAPPGVPAFDAEGRFVTPGFVDGHAHLLGTGAAMHSIQLKAVPSAEEAVRRVAQRVATTPAGGWVRGAGWDQHAWPGGSFPDRTMLDAVAPHRPVVLTHTSGHCTWVNTAALRAAGITAATRAPAGGTIDIGDDGEPSGILRDTASRLVTDAAPNPTQIERITALDEAIAHAHSLGVTGAHAMDVGRGEFQALHALHDGGRLRFRVRSFLTATRLSEWFERAVATGDGDDMLRIGGIKFFADGALGSLTAWMLEPCAEDAGVGFPLQPVEELEAQVRACLEQGLAPAIHAIGDRANREVLGILERSRDIASGLPRRIEHAQLLAAGDVARFGGLGITASVQPIHATQDMEKVDRYWGARGAGAYAFARLLATGANLAFGSDTPVETMSPLAGIHAAVTRERPDGTPPGGWYAGERISIESALHAHTAGCATAIHEQSHWGRIAPGCFGDVTVLSHNLTAANPSAILETTVDATVVAGEVVFRRT